MSNIEKYIPTGITTIASVPAVKEIIDALESKTVSAALIPDIFYYVKSGVLKSYADLGYKIKDTVEGEPDETEYLITEVVKDIRKNFPALRLDEIHIAFKRGVRKEYGDFMGLSVVSFMSFIANYMKAEARKNALLERAKANAEKPVVPTFNEVYDIAKSNALNALKDIENGKDITFSGSVVYDFLEGIGLIELKDEEIIEIRKEARRMLVSGYENKVELDKFKRMDNALIVEALLDVAKPQDRVKHLVKSKAKCIAVKTFMQSCLMEDTDLAELIESKRADASIEGATMATDR